jgi:hypothetical protein
LYRESSWLENCAQDKGQFPGVPKPRLLVSLAAFLENSSSSYSFSPLNIRMILASLEERLDHMRSLSRYLMGLLVFLGLLGTFWGLSKTIGAIAGVINGLEISTNDFNVAMDHLKEGLRMPLSGMGTAFSCSLFGLTGSLIVGFLDLIVSKACTRFLYYVEENLMGDARISSLTELTTSSSGPAFSAALLEQTIETLSQMQGQMIKSEKAYLQLTRSVQTLSDKLMQVVDQGHQSQMIVKKMAQNQTDLQEHLKELTRAMTYLGDNVLKNHLGNIDMNLNKFMEDFSSDSKKNVQEIKGEIRIIAKTLSAIASGQDIAAA